ncbi:hypothetical protein SPLC1_S033670 [Arthrospira platensis C1]|nr:hypothetical protein SPLC1_S033670 [Arthrospira platensis C1]RAQ38962.1 hypothetical protein B9S53_24435 [Arthrospira sp. O9.13F]
MLSITSGQQKSHQPALWGSAVNYLWSAEESSTRPLGWRCQLPMLTRRLINPPLGLGVVGNYQKC